MPNFIVILVVVVSDAAVKHSDKYVCHIAAIQRTSVSLAGHGTEMLLTHRLTTKPLSSPTGHVYISNNSHRLFLCSLSLN